MTNTTRVVASALIVLALLALPRQAGAAPVLLVDDAGILYGASGVALDGEVYDVQFVDLTCNGAFDGCNEPLDFDFTTEAGALNAAQALLDQVLTGVFDTFPERVAGCSSTFSCAILIPYAAVGDLAAVAVSYNLSNGSANSTGLSYITRSENTKLLSQLVFADWSPALRQGSEVSSTDASLVPVPEPASLVLLGTGLAAAASAARRRNKRRAAFREDLPAA